MTECVSTERKSLRERIRIKHAEEEEKRRLFLAKPVPPPAPPRRVSFAENGQILVFNKGESVEFMRQDSETGEFRINFNNRELNFNDATPRRRKYHLGKRRILIFGDRHVKHINDIKIMNCISRSHVNSFSFPGLSVTGMQALCRRYSSELTDTYIIHAGSHDVTTDDTAGDIAVNIVSFALSLKMTDNDVIVSDLVERMDRKDYTEKCWEVNEALADLCPINDIRLCKNDNIYGDKHLDESRFHLNRIGEYILENNFVEHLKV